MRGVQRVCAKAECVTLNQCFGTLCGQFCSAPFDPRPWTILTLWLDLPECHPTASHQVLRAPLASFHVACLAYRVAASLTERTHQNALHIPLARIGPPGFAG